MLRNIAFSVINQNYRIIYHVEQYGEWICLIKKNIRFVTKVLLLMSSTPVCGIKQYGRNSVHSTAPARFPSENHVIPQ